MTGSALARWVAAYGLPGHQAARMQLSEPLSASEWDALMAGIRRWRLAGFLHAAVVDGAIPVTDQQRAEAESAHLAACGTALRLDHWLLQLTTILDESGIDFLALKGAAHAHLVYPDPALRSYGDVDVLFPSEQFSWALDVLYSHGYTRPVAEVRPGFDRRFGKGATLRGADGGELDTHRNLVFGTFGFAIDLDELFASAVSFELGGVPVRVLGPETRLLHACYHAALGDPKPRFGSIRDVAQMLATGTHDDLRVLALAREWRARAVVARAVSLCRNHLGVTVQSPLVDALSDYKPTVREQRAIDSYVGPNRHFAVKVVASLPYLDGFRDKLAFLGATAWPSRQFIATRADGAGGAWIRRGLRSLLHGGPR